MAPMLGSKGWLLLLLACGGCHHGDQPKADPSAPAAEGDPYARDLAMICEAPARSNAQGDGPAKATAIAKWIDAQPKTDRAKDFFSKLWTLDAPARIAKLRAEAAANGVKSCPLADLWASWAALPPVKAQE